VYIEGVTSFEIIHLRIREKIMFVWLRMRFKFVTNLLSITPTLGLYRDAYFFEDEEQLAMELAAPLPDGLVPQHLPEVDPDEFEKLYIWFLS
jgi:hypothetical protein